MADNQVFPKAWGARMLRVIKSGDVWLLSLVIVITPSVLRAIGAIKD